MPTDTTIRNMREWLSKHCGNSFGLTRSLVLDMIELHFPGGLAGFLWH